METILIHQMAKVGSTAIQQSLADIGLPSLQTHAIGRDLLFRVIDFYLDPETDIERVRNEQKMFQDQMLATKMVEDAKQPSGTHLPIITLSRDPIDRWFSALVQNYRFHAASARKYFGLRHHNQPSDDEEAFEAAFSDLLSLVTAAPAPLGSDEFFRHYWHIDHTGNARANHLLTQLGAELTLPFYWFDDNLRGPLGIDLFGHDVGEGIVSVRKGSFRLLYLRYELMQEQPERAEAALSEFIGRDLRLGRQNLSINKPGFRVVSSLRDRLSPAFRNARAVRRSAYCRHFGY